MPKNFETTRLEVTKIPTQLKKKFKAACALNDVTMNQVLIEYMKKYTIEQKYLNEDEKFTLKDL